MTPLILHHANCPDGFGAAWWLAKNLPLPDHRPAQIMPAAYTDDTAPFVEAARDRQVYIVDFCFPGDVLDEIVKVSVGLTVLDHHQTAQQYVDDSQLVTKYPSIGALWADDPSRMDVAVIDEDHSGVGLVVQYVEQIRPVTSHPTFLDNLEDRDLWRFQLPDTRDVFAAVTAFDYTFENWNRLAELPHEELRTMGRPINLYRDRLIRQVCEDAFPIVMGVDAEALCVSSPYAIGSDVAGELAKRSKSGIGAYVILEPDGRVQVGLRSTPDGPDVAEIAEAFGGGGHKHASGLEVSSEQIQGWMA